MTTERTILEAKIYTTKEQLYAIEDQLFVLDTDVYDVGSNPALRRSLRGRRGALRVKLDKLQLALAQLDQLTLPGVMD
jgi:hypothetical protein